MMDVYKKTALRLHGLAESDRQWLLDHLQDHQRRRLVPLLEELTALGIPKQAGLAEDLEEVKTSAPSDAAVPEPAEAPPAHVQPLLDAAPDTIFDLLKHEGPATIAAMMLAYPWPWRQAVLADFETPLKMSISDAMTQMEGRLSAPVSRSVVCAVAALLGQPSQACDGEDEAGGEPEPPIRRRSFFRRWSWRK